MLNKTIILIKPIIADPKTNKGWYTFIISKDFNKFDFKLYLQNLYGINSQSVKKITSRVLRNGLKKVSVQILEG
jgi:ribosomal protein L23